MLTATKEQVNPTLVIRTRADLKQAMSDLEFYANLAITKGESLEMDLWAEVGKVVAQRSVTKKATEEPKPLVAGESSWNN